MSESESGAPNDDFIARGSPEYYVKDLDISASPKLGKTLPGQVTVEIDMKNPELDRDNQQFICNCELYVELFAERLKNRPKADEFSKDDIERLDYGDIEVELRILLEPSFENSESEEIEEWLDQIDSEIEVWRRDGYEEVDRSFQFQLEGDILSEVLVPLGDLLDTGFKGLIPSMMFRAPPDVPDDSDEPDSE